MEPIETACMRKPTALITGAAGGLGKAFAVECASRGWNLFLTDTTAVPLETLAASLRQGYGVTVHTHPCDLTDPTARADLFRQVRVESMRLSTLINVAGVDYEGMFFEQTGHQIQTIIRLNIEGTLEMIHSALPFRDPMRTFRIINVCSLAAFYPMPVKATYSASKRFLLNFSIALREEVREMNATVTALCPAGMPTNIECVQAIEAQGLVGEITTVDVGRVANQTLNAALAGKAVVIPGGINRTIQTLGSLVPPSWVAGLIGSRWKSVRQKRELEGSLPAA